MNTLQSMTGYGEASLEDNTCYIHTTIKTINNKYLDIQATLPKGLIQRENTWRKRFKTHLKRGTVLFEITYLTKQYPVKNLINKNLVKGCYQELNKLANELGAQTDLLSYALQTSQTIIPPIEPSISKNQVVAIEKTVQEALEACVNTRKKEATQLYKQLLNCLQTLHDKLAELEERLPERNLALRNKLKEKMALKSEVCDVTPLQPEQEILDVEEEKIRIKSHLAFFQQTLSQSGVVGRKLLFIAQEIGRELNTIASKAQDSILQHIVVEMKLALEQAKEQLQNLV